MGSCFSQDTQQQLHSIDMKSWKLPENLSLSTHHISRLFELFRFMDIDQDGLICCKDILRFTNLPITILNERLFLLVDNNYKRNISFPDFVMGLCRLCTIDDMGMAKFLFQVFDIDHKGILTMEECDALLRMIHNTEKADRNCMYSIQSYCQEGGMVISFEGLFKAIEKYPYIIKPALNFQSIIRKKFLGEDVWVQISKQGEKSLSS